MLKASKLSMRSTKPGGGGWCGRLPSADGVERRDDGGLLRRERPIACRPTTSSRDAEMLMGRHKDKDDGRERPDGGRMETLSVRIASVASFALMPFCAFGFRSLRRAARKCG